MLDGTRKIDTVIRRGWQVASLVALMLLAFKASAQIQAHSTAQSSPQADQSAIVQVQILTDRISMLEQKLAALSAKVAIDEASGMNNPQTASPVTGVDDGSPAASPSPNVPAGGSKSVSPGVAPKTSPDDASNLSKSDQARLAKVETQVSALTAQQKGNAQKNRITAPFQVVDSNGAVILDVEDGMKDGSFRGLQVKSLNGSFAQIGGRGANSFPNVGVYLAGKDAPRIALGLHQDGRPAVAINSLTSGRVATELTEDHGGGTMQFFEPGGQVVINMGAAPETGNGYAQFNGTTPGAGVQIGVMGEHGDVAMVGHDRAFTAWAQFILGGVPRP